jgi:hypothetical protein
MMMREILSRINRQTFATIKTTVNENRTHTLAFSQTQERVSVSLSLSDVYFCFVFKENVMKKIASFFPQTQRGKRAKEWRSERASSSSFENDGGRGGRGRRRGAGKRGKVGNGGSFAAVCRVGGLFFQIARRRTTTTTTRGDKAVRADRVASTEQNETTRGHFILAEDGPTDSVHALGGIHWSEETDGE